MSKLLPKNKNYITIAEAAAILGVTKRTLQRWVKAGKLQAIRPSGKECYFTIEEIERHRQRDPLNIEEAAKLLNITPAEFLAYENKGLIIKLPTEEAPDGGYSKESVEQLLHTLFYMQQKTKQGPNAPPQMLSMADNPQKEKPTEGMTALLKEESAADDHAVQQVMGTVIVEDTHYLHKLHLVHKALFFVILAVLGFFAVMVFVITLFFLIVPQQAAEFFGYEYRPTGSLSKSEKVLGVSDSTYENLHPLGQFLQPFSNVALGVVKQIDQKKHHDIIPKKKLSTNDIFMVNNEGDLVLRPDVKITGNTFSGVDENLVSELKRELVTLDTTVATIVERERSEYDDNGNQLARASPVFTIATGQIISSYLAEGAVTTGSIADGAVTSVKLAEGIGLLGNNAVTSAYIKNGEVKEEDVADSAVTTSKIADGAISDIKLSQITANNKVSGSAVQLSTGGGLVNSSGLSLLRTCADGEVLAWSTVSSVWECSAVSGGGGDITSVIAGVGLTGGGTSGAVTLDTVLGTTVDLTSEVTGILPVANGGTGATTFTDLLTLGTHTTGNYVGSVSGGSGITIGGSAGEAWAPSVALGALTGDWNQSGAFDIVLAHASSELRVLESTGGAFYGTFDVGDLGADQVYTFGIGGTVYTSGNDPFDTTGEIQAVTTGGDVSGAISNIQIATGAVGTNEASGLDISSDTNLSASDGITLTGDALTNTDKGSSQNIFKTMMVSGQSDVVSDANGDALTFAAGSNITLTTDASTDTITITASGGGSYTAGNDLDLTGSTFDLESVIDTVSTINLAGTGTLNGLDAIDATTESTIESAIDTLANLTSASSLATVGTLTSGSTGAGFTLNFGTSTLSGNVGGGNIDESSLAGLATSNFTSAAVSQWTNDAGYITDGNTGWNNSYGFITASSTDTLTNKSGNISQWTNDSAYITDGNTNWNNSYGLITASSNDALTNKTGNISMWTNDSGYLTTVDISANTNLSASDGITLTGDALTNSDKGSSQNIFKTIAVSGQNNVVTDANGDTLTLAAGSNVTITTNDATDTVTIAATDTNTTYSAGNDLDLTGTTFDLESTLDIVSTINLAGTGTLNGLDVIDATSESTIESAIDTLANLTSASSLATVGTLTGGSTGAGFTLNFGTSTLSGNIGGGNIDESSLAGLGTSNFTSAAISQWTNDSGYITDGNTNWNNSYGFITASSSDALTNKTGNISQWTNDSGYLTTVDVSGNSNLSAANGVTLTGDALSLDVAYTPTWTNLHTFTRAGAQMLLKPASAPAANTKLLDAQATGVGTTVFSVDYEGDVVANSLSVTTGLTDANVSDALTISSAGSVDVAALSGTVGDANVADGLTISGGTVNNSVIGGTSAAAGTFTDLTANGNTVLGDGTGNDSVTIRKNGSGNVTFTGYASCTALETDGSGNLTCGADDTGGGTGSLDVAYDNGSSITVDASDVVFNLADATNDYKFTVNNSTNGAIATGLAFTTSVASGTFGTAIDLSDADIATALALGSNDVTVGGVTLASTELALLDNKTTLVDTDDAVSTAITGTGTLTAGSTGAGFTLNFGTSTLSGNIGGGNIDESSLAGLGTSNFTSAAVSQWTNDSGYLTTVDVSANTNLSASDGITLTGDALTNSDKGSSQNIFKTYAVSGQSDVVTDTNADTLTFAAGSNITLTTNAGTDTITIAATDTNTTYSAGNDLDLTGTTFDLESTLDIVSTINLAGTGTLNGLDAIDATSESTIESAIDTLGNLTSASSLATVGTLTGGSTGAGFTLNFGTSTLSGNIGGGNIDESSLAGLGTSNFTSAAISQWTNDSGYLTSVSNGNLGDDTINLTKVADSLTFDNSLTFVSDNSTNDYKLVLDNSSTGDIAELFQVTTTGVGATVATALNLSDADIATALALGSNDVTVGGVTIDATEFARLNGINAALIDIDDAVATAITGTGTLTAGSTGAGFTLNFGTSTLSGDITGANISSLDISSDTNLSASDGITLTGDALTNSDKGSSQNIFKTIAVSGQNNVVTDANGDTLTLAAGSNVTITTDDTTDTVTITAADTNTTYSAGNDLDLTGTTFALETTLDFVDTINLAGTGTLNGLDAIDATSESTIESAIDTLGNLTSASALATVGTLTGGSTGAGFTLNFGTSTLSGNIGGGNIDESSLAGLGTSNFTSAAVSQWTNDSGYLTSVSNGNLGDDTIDLTKVADSLTLDAGLTFVSDNSTNDYKVVFDNSSTGDIATLLQVTTTGVGGTIATALDLSDADIATGLALGSNDVTVNGVTLSASEFGLLDGGVALSELTDSGTLTVGTVDINGGAIDGAAIGANSRSTGAFTTLGSNSTVTLGDGSGNDSITLDDGSGNITLTGYNTCTALETNGSGQIVCGTDDTGAGGAIATIQANDVDAVTSATTIDFLGSDFDVAAAGAEGDISIDYTNSGIARKNQSETVINDWTFSLAEGEDVAINLAVSGTNAGTGETITLTNTSSSGNQYGLYLDNAASSGTTDSLLVIDNSDADTAVTNAIEFVNAGGGFTNLFNVAGTLITSTEFTLLDGGVALSELTDSGTLTVGTVDINGGAIDGAVIGANSAAAGTFTSVTASSAIAANGGITFDQSTDTLGAFTLAGTVDANANIITNIGSTGSDFDTTGALALQLDGVDADGALSVDNAANASSIFVAEDNGTPVFTIADGGIVTATANVNADGGFDVDDTFVVANGGVVSGLSISDTDVPLTGASFTFDFNNAADRTFSITNSAGGLAFLSVEGDLTVSGGDITGANSDSIDIGETADATFTFVRNNTGTVTITSADDNADAALTVSAGGTGALTLGDSGSTTAITSSDWAIDVTGAITGISFDANGSGNAISNIETGDIANGTLDADDLDFATEDGAAADGECLKYETSGGGDFKWDPCGGGGANWDTIGDPSGNGAVAMAETVQTLDWNTAATSAVFDGLTLTMTNDATSDGGVQNLLTLANIDDGAGAGATEALLVIDNRDSNEAVADGIRITSAAGGITTGLDFDDTDITTDIELQNGETIDNNSDGIILLTATTIDISGALQAGSSNVALTLSTGFIDGDALTLTTSGNTGATSSNSGLEVQSDGLTLLKGCSDNQILKYTDAGGWACADDNTGGGGGGSNWTLSDGILRPNNNTADVLFGGTSTGSAKFALMNLNSNSGLDPMASFSAHVMIGPRPDSTPAQLTTWTKISQTTSGTIANGGTANIASISASIVYNGSLYVGTMRDASGGSAEIYRYDGTGSNWTKVSQSTAGQIASGGTSGIASVSAMTVFDGRLYVGTSKLNEAEIYRYDGGTTWTRISSGTPGTIGTTASQDGVSAMGVYNGVMYAGTREGTMAAGGARLLRWEGGAAWTAINTTGGTFVTTNSANVHAVTAIQSYAGQLFIGVSKAGDADLLRYQGNTGGSVFLSMNAAGLTGSYAINGGAVTAFDEITSMVVYNNSLLIALRKNNAAELVYLNSNAPITAAGANFTRFYTVGAGNINGGTTGIDAISTMAIYYGVLYLGTYEPNSAELYRYVGANLKFQKVSGTAGTVGGGSTTGIDGISSLIQFNGSLIAGTYEAGQAEVYSHTFITSQSYQLQFHADPAVVGEAGDQHNYASLYFIASASANLSSSGSNTGAIISTHGIQTRVGSYDVAEDYPTRDDTVAIGDLVSIDPAESGYVKKSEGAYDHMVIGVYSENPALRLSQIDPSIDGAKTIPVALAGRVPVKVSTENGPIEPGDFLTASSVPGIAMKATRSGVVFGQSMGKYSGEGVGKVTVYIKSTTYQGSLASDVANFQVATDGSGEEILASLMTQSIDVATTEVKVDRVIAGLEIVAPKIIADEIIAKSIKADRIEGLEIYTNKLASLEEAVLGLQSVGASASAIVASTETLPEAASSSSTLLSNEVALDNLFVDGVATISGQLTSDKVRVKDSLLVEAMAHVADTLTTARLIVNDIATFFGDVVFKSDVKIDGKLTVGKDSAGIATVKKGTDQIEITFAKEYEDKPIVTISLNVDENEDSLETLLLQSDIKYIITKRSKGGFIIKLNQKAPADIRFSWTAVEQNKDVVGAPVPTQAVDEQQYVTPTLIISAPPIEPTPIL